MRVELPSGNWVEIRDTLKAKDKFSVQNAIASSMEMTAAGTAKVPGNVMSLMQSSLMARIIQSWSFTDPLPGAHACQECMGNSRAWHEHVSDGIGELLDLDDYNKLEEVISPLLEKVMSAPNLGTPSG